jgi:ketosteroid isomerase-like protein
MRRSMPLLVACVVGALSTPAVALAEQHCRANTPGVAEIRNVANGIVNADNERDLGRVLDYYTLDAVLLPPNEGPVVGRTAIGPRYQKLFAEFEPVIRGSVEEACAYDGMGFVRGRNGGGLRPAGTTGPLRELDDTYLMLLRKGEDGKWRISHLMWHRGSPAPPQPAP